MPRPGGFGRGVPATDPPGAGDRLDGGVKHGVFVRFCAAGGLSLGTAGATVMVAGAGCLLRAWVAARPRSVPLSTRCIKFLKANCGHFVDPSLFFSGDDAVWLGECRALEQRASGWRVETKQAVEQGAQRLDQATRGVDGG